jgi:hypothetical protein
MNLVASLVVLAVMLTGCSSGKVKPDAALADAGNSGASSPPALGAQIDRLGRPAISAALIGTFAAPEATRTAVKDAYNVASDPATWKTATLPPLPAASTIERELAANLAVFDAIDRGLSITKSGCGNAYTGAATPMSYLATADLLADDQLYVDTSKPTCTVYFDLEIEQASAGSFIHQTCGGRTLTHDVIDMSYSVLAASTLGLDPANNFAPKIGDGVAAHTDISTTFPFLGPPH